MKKIFYDGVFSGEKEGQTPLEALYVEEGTIRDRGSSADMLLQHGRADVARVDLEGGFFYPGLMDSHMHLAAQGKKMSFLDLSGARTKEEMLYLLKRRVEQTDRGEWVIAIQWDENRLLEGKPPSLQELDEVAPAHPLFLLRSCYHISLANTEAFRRAGIREGTPDPEEGSWGRDIAGRFDGWVYENASLPFYRAQPQLSYEERKECVRRAMKLALQYGLTGVHTDDLREIGSLSDLIRIYRELGEEGWKLRSHHLVYYPYLKEMRDEGIPPCYGDEYFRLGAVKLFADGAIGGRTAWLSSPYSDDPSKVGMAIRTEEKWEHLMQEIRQSNLPIAVHAIGDAAAEQVIRMVEKYPLSRTDVPLPDRLIHGQVLRPDLLGRLRELPLVVDIQPSFVLSDFPWVEKRLGKERLLYAYAWKTMLKHGLTVAGGSDAPIESMHPLIGMQAAVMRRPPEERNHEGYQPQECLTVEEALSLYTRGSALAVGEGKRSGSLERGMRADISVYDRSLKETPPDQWGGIATRMTIIGGEIQYKE
ncbi:amidohydrolase [Mechercharimyces sp. CAU 1602]|uniref:amidohydrolase n=1 Tax=Mechercharimyces sp. CAU 1602 TaxID=2973933 RepID=UPI0021622079|nr:amidohydrolase [Mechercharimyces sp. CAU 1602]MCS1350034.1 amidohydrolase [Mechercharimyces sp. CAU 1602]